MLDRLEFTTTKKDGHIIIEIRGEMDVYNSFELKNLMEELSQNGSTKFILKMGALSYIDSSGLGALINQQMRLQKSGGEMFLVSLSDQVRSVLELTKMHSFFKISGSENEALSASSAA